MPDLLRGEGVSDKTPILCHRRGMTEKRELRRSDVRRLQPRRCQKCGFTEYPDFRDAPGMDAAEPNPIVIGSYVCTNPTCNNNIG